jgi:hypothetical protein
MSELGVRASRRYASLRVDPIEEEAELLDNDGLRRLSGEGLVRYSNRGELQLEQAKCEAFRRLTRRVFKSKLDKKKPADLDG